MSDEIYIDGSWRPIRDVAGSVAAMLAVLDKGDEIAVGSAEQARAHYSTTNSLLDLIATGRVLSVNIDVVEAMRDMWNEVHEARESHMYRENQRNLTRIAQDKAIAERNADLNRFGACSTQAEKNARGGSPVYPHTLARIVGYQDTAANVAKYYAFYLNAYNRLISDPLHREPLAMWEIELLWSEAPTGLCESDFAFIRDQILTGHKIQAIKRFRNITGKTLKESVDACNSLERILGVK